MYRQINSYLQIQCKHFVCLFTWWAGSRQVYRQIRCSINYIDIILKKVFNSKIRLGYIEKNILQREKANNFILSPVEHEVYFSRELGDLLNLDSLNLKKYSGERFRDVFPLTQLRNLILSSNHTFLDSLFNSKQEIQYHIVRKRMKKKNSFQSYLKMIDCTLSKLI